MKNQKESTSTLNATVSNQSRSKKERNDLDNDPRLNYNLSKFFTKFDAKRQKRQAPRTCIVNKCSLVSFGLLYSYINKVSFASGELNVELFS